VLARLHEAMFELSMEADGSSRTVRGIPPRGNSGLACGILHLYLCCRRTALSLGFLCRSFNYVRILHQTLGRFNFLCCGSSSLCTCHMGLELVTGKVHPYVSLDSLVGVYGSPILIPHPKGIIVSDFP